MMWQKSQRVIFWLPGIDGEVARWFESEPEQNAARRYVSFRVLRSPRYYLASLFILLLAIALIRHGGPLLSRILAPWLGTVPFRRVIFDLIAVAIVTPISIQVYIWLLRDIERRLLWDYVNRNGGRVCRHCGYDLRGSPEPRCAECGTSFSSGEKE